MARELFNTIGIQIIHSRSGCMGWRTLYIKMYAIPICSVFCLTKDTASGTICWRQPSVVNYPVPFPKNIKSPLSFQTKLLQNIQMMVFLQRSMHVVTQSSPAFGDGYSQNYPIWLIEFRPAFLVTHLGVTHESLSRSNCSRELEAIVVESNCDNARTTNYVLPDRFRIAVSTPKKAQLIPSLSKSNPDGTFSRTRPLNKEGQH